MKWKKNNVKAFNLAEIVIVVALIAILGSVAMINAFRFIEKAKVAQVYNDQKVFRDAVTAYAHDVGTWPPDVCVAEDPGFLAWDNYEKNCNPDGWGGQIGGSGDGCGGCGHNVVLPYGGPNNGSGLCTGSYPAVSNYRSLVQKRWNGPYIEKFPPQTPWGGSYDYEYWADGQGIVGCTGNRLRGIFVSVRGNGGCKMPLYYRDPDRPGVESTHVPSAYEIKFQQTGFDVSFCNVDTTNGNVVFAVQQW
jgi:type II secretory pathway pseudopilin PulG